MFVVKDSPALQSGEMLAMSVLRLNIQLRKRRDDERSSTNQAGVGGLLLHKRLDLSPPARLSYMG